VISFIVSCVHSFSPWFLLLGFHLAEQGVQALEVGFPKIAVPREPNLKLPERSGAQGINAALSVHANIHETGVTEDTEMLGDLRLAQTQAMGHVPDRARASTQELDDVQSVGLGERSKRSDHAT
jgi:hypothetical protein